MEIINVSKAFVHRGRSRKTLVQPRRQPGMGHGEGKKKSDLKILYKNMNFSVKKLPVYFK